MILPEESNIKNVMEKFMKILVEFILLKKFLGNSEIKLDKNRNNHEIEDLIYPEIICHLVNKILNKFTQISSNAVRKNFSTFISSNGILNLIENEKNEKNLENGDKISFISSGENTNEIKKGMARMFKISGDKKLGDIIEKARKNIPL